MTGNNMMQLNEATMIEIVQYWMANKFLNKDEPSPKVTGVRATGQTGNAFQIDLSQSQQ